MPLLCNDDIEVDALAFCLAFSSPHPLPHPLCTGLWRQKASCCATTTSTWMQWQLHRPSDRLPPPFVPPPCSPRHPLCTGLWRRKASCCATMSIEVDAIALHLAFDPPPLPPLPRPHPLCTGLWRRKASCCADDDIEVDAVALRLAFDRWQEDKYRLVGFFPRAHFKEVEGARVGQLSYVLTPNRYPPSLMVLRPETNPLRGSGV